MSKIPEPLAARFETLQKLEEARDLLRRLPPDGSEIEREFLQDKFSRLKDDLAAGEAEAMRLLDLIRDDSVAWTAAALRFRRGYSWDMVAAYLGATPEAASARVYRAFQRAEKGPKRRRNGEKPPHSKA